MVNPYESPAAATGRRGWGSRGRCLGALLLGMVCLGAMPLVRAYRNTHIDAMDYGLTAETRDAALQMYETCNRVNQGLLLSTIICAIVAIVAAVGWWKQRRLS